MVKKSRKEHAAKKTSIGGQALIEGIMMRGPEKSALAVRRPNGEIFFEIKETQKKKRPAICRWPFIRGIFGFVDSMVLGYRCLERSAEIYCEEPETSDADKSNADKSEQTDLTVPDNTVTVEVPTDSESNQKKETENKSTVGKKTMTGLMIISVVLAFVLVLGLFVWLPTFIFSKLAYILPDRLSGDRLFRSAFEGIFKIILLVAYMALVSLMKDIRRTFMYHGAEHKTIFCYEHGLPLTVENVRKQRRFHPRCGTSFLILMLLVSVLVGIFIPSEISGVNPTAYTFIRTAIKILLIPLIMGIGYELLKLAGRHDNLFTKIISAPGLWLQRITVREPTDDMIECAIKAFLAVVPEDESDNW